MIQKIILNIGENPRKARPWLASVICFVTLNGWCVWGKAAAPQDKFCNLSPTFIFSNSISSSNCYTKLLPSWKYKHFFLKNGNLIINWLLLYCTKCCTERVSSPSDKIWKQEDFKNPNFQTIWRIGKDLEVQPTII